jgi:hypothetical protein
VVRQIWTAKRRSTSKEGKYSPQWSVWSQKPPKIFLVKIQGNGEEMIPNGQSKERTIFALLERDSQYGLRL